LRFLQEVGHQHVLQRKTGAPGFPEGLVDHADTEQQAEHFHQRLPNPRPGQPQAQRKEHDESGQLRTDQAPFAQLNPLPLMLSRGPPGLRTADMVAVVAVRFKQIVTDDKEHQPNPALDRRGNVDLVPGGVTLRRSVR
jgi:hypothetical protein